jgi:hypothetical protein
MQYYCRCVKAARARRGGSALVSAVSAAAAAMLGAVTAGVVVCVVFVASGQGRQKEA